MNYLKILIIRSHNYYQPINLYFNITHVWILGMKKLILSIFLLAIIAFTQDPQIHQASVPQVQTAGETITAEQLKQRQKQKQKQRQQQIERMKQDPQLRQQLEREQKERAERTAKYRAEQQRIKQMRRKQKQAQNKRNRQMQINEQQKVDYKQDKVESETQKVKKQELNSLIQAANMHQQGSERGSERGSQGGYKKAMFEVNKKIEQFILTPSINETMFLHCNLYIQQDGVFSETKDVTKQQPLKVYIYEDNTRIIAQSSFFFKNLMVFDVKGGSKYIIRFYNSGSLKLVNMRYKSYVSQQKTQKMYSQDKGKQQLEKAKNLMDSIDDTIQELQLSQLVDLKNTQTLMGSISKYFGYQIIQILFVLVICFVQMHFIKQMFKSVSIL